MCQSYRPRFPPVDVSITTVINRYSSESMTRVEEHLKRIFDYFFSEGFIRCSVYFRLDRDRAEFDIEDYSIFISPSDLGSFL